MSEIFHKSCYTSRSSGYKYRTLSTNTGVRKRRASEEDNTFDKKFRELHREIMSRVDAQVSLTQRARDSIEDKFNKIDMKISSMLELQKTVASLRNSLQAAESSLTDVMYKVDKMETMAADSEYSINSKKSSFRSTIPIAEEKEIFESDITQL